MASSTSGGPGMDDEENSRFFRFSARSDALSLDSVAGLFISANSLRANPYGVSSSAAD